MKSASPGPCLASGGLCGRSTSSSGPLQGQLLPPAQPFLQPKLCRHAFCLPVACADAALTEEQPLQAPLLPPRGLSRPSLDLAVAPPGPPLASPWPPRARLLPFGGLCRPSSCLPVASVGQAPASTAAFPGLAFAPLHPRQALNLLQSASPGPALPPGGLCRPKLSSSGPLQGRLLPPAGLCGPKSSSSRPPPAQLLPLGGLFRCTTSSSRPLQAQLLLPRSGLFRPIPAHTSRRPSQAPRLTFGGPFRPRARPPVGLSRPTSCLPTASLGPARSSRRPFRARFVPFGGLSRPSTSSSRPLPTQLQPHGVLSRPSSSSRLRLRARLLPHSHRLGLSSWPAPGGLCCPKTSSSHALPAQLRPPRWPLWAQLLALRRRLWAPRHPPVGSSRPSLGLPAASAGPTRREVGLPGPRSGLPAASAGTARPRVGPSRASSCLPSASRGPASASLMAAPRGPALPRSPGCVDRPNSCLPRKANKLFRLSSCPAPASLCGPSPFSSRSSASPPSASWWPAQTQP
ncbi:proline-rich protein 36-like [Pongo abelii]|uniref:proline-rich protein 36-like n=1 Tax=Pongo abelii TaxID=9601 RepID=UPI003003DC90